MRLQALLGVLFLLMAGQSLAAGAGIRELPESYELNTSDGLSVHLSRANGEVSIERGGARPALSFEEVAPIANARDLMGGEFGREWMQVKSTDRTRPTRAVVLNQTRAEPVIVSGWCKYETQATAAGWMNRALAVNMVGTYVDGEKMPERSAYFGCYNHGSQSSAAVLCPEKPLKEVQVTANCDNANSTAWFKDISLRRAEYRVTTVRGACSRYDTYVSQEFSDKASGLRGLVTYLPSEDCISVKCRFRSERKTDRAVSVYLTIPFDAVGGRWYDDARRSRKIEPGKVYRRSDRWYGAGRDGYDDRYPFGCVENAGGDALAIATDPMEPRVFRIEYDAVNRELRVRYDIGLSPDAGTWANRGSFSAVLYRVNGGFRGALEKYQRIYGPAFDRRGSRDGMWMAFSSPEAIPGGWEDFGIRYVESQTNTGWEHSRGMCSMRYVEPWIDHQFDMGDVVLDESKGPIDPMGAVRTAERWRTRSGPGIPKDAIDRFAAYVGSYITDAWGQPQGYFFREPARKENMMIVNPNPRLPAPEGSHFSVGELDWDYLMEGLRQPAQWHIRGWSFIRTIELPFAQIDGQEKTEGKQSLRLDPIRSRSFTQPYCRGLNQTFYYESTNQPFEFSYSVLRKNVPVDGGKFAWTITFWYPDRSTERFSDVPKGKDGEWERRSVVLKPRAAPAAVTVSFGKDNMSVDPSTIWLDDVRLVREGTTVNLVSNGGFESAEMLPSEMGGIYLDTLECYENNLNYRREHWRYADEPLTFDTARKPALQQQFSHISFARKAAEWARSRGQIVFANCAPITCFAAPYLDAMGAEENWAPGGVWTPKSDEAFSFVRSMCGRKSWTILQYGKLTDEQVERYVKRCVFYGVYPGWTYDLLDPIFVAGIRPLYAKMMPILKEINEAGWQPVTGASSSNPDVWLERSGESGKCYLTVFNPTAKNQSAEIRLAAPAKGEVVEMIDGNVIAHEGSTVKIELGPEDLRVIRLGDQ